LKINLWKKVEPALVVTLLLILLSLAPSFATQVFARFEDYEAPIFNGTIRLPQWIRHVNGDEWRDELGKLVGPPEINFAGKYYVMVHSCGTGCRYYTMDDLSTGRAVDLLKGFDAAEPSPKIREGNPYITDLITRPNSRLLIAQYHIELPGGEECRERAFVLKGRGLRPVTSTRRTCKDYSER
jgi:hypothetical protein